MRQQGRGPKGAHKAISNFVHMPYTLNREVRRIRFPHSQNQSSCVHCVLLRASNTGKISFQFLFQPLQFVENNFL